MSAEQQPVAILSWEQADQIMQDQRAEIERLRAELSDARKQGEPGQPVLTDSEREAISAAACICEDAGRTDIAIVINEAMARLEGER